MFNLAKANRIAKQERRVIITPKDRDGLRVAQMEKMKIRNRKAAERRQNYFK